jgi:hypothetical protein
VHTLRKCQKELVKLTILTMDINQYIFFQGTKAYDKLNGILMKKSVLKDISKLSPDAQTSALEGFHSTLNQWHPKMFCFSWLGTYCR